MKLTPTPLTAALAGVFSALVMPVLWTRLASDSISMVLAFVLVVALPAHAFVVGFARPAGDGRSLDVALLKRVGAWLVASAATLVLAQVLRA